MSILTNPPNSPPEEPFEHPRTVCERIDSNVGRIYDLLDAIERDVEGGFDDGAFTPKHAEAHEAFIDALAQLSHAWARVDRLAQAFQTVRLARRITRKDLR